ncbi:MAG: hypothetical protein AABY22_36695 [Nanoarchaeota archaeon]
MPCYKVYIKGLYSNRGYQSVRYTNSKGRRKSKKYPTRKGAERRLNLEKERGGWSGKIVKC